MPNKRKDRKGIVFITEELRKTEIEKKQEQKQKKKKKKKTLNKHIYVYSVLLWFFITMLHTKA